MTDDILMVYFSFTFLSQLWMARLVAVAKDGSFYEIAKWVGQIYHNHSSCPGFPKNLTYNRPFVIGGFYLQCWPQRLQ